MMHTDRRQLLLLLMTIYIGPYVEGCEFSDSPPYIRFICNNRNLTEVPTDVPRTITHLNLGDNYISYLKNGSFKSLANVTSLYLNDNQIAWIEEGAFIGLEKLSLLHLARNSIGSLESGIFSGLFSLYSLYLYNNQIAWIEEGAFIGLEKLSYLSLVRNNISSLESGIFSGLFSLYSLYFRFNPIRSIDGRTFYDLHNVRWLYLDEMNCSCASKALTEWILLRKNEVFSFFLSCEGRNSEFLDSDLGSCAAEDSLFQENLNCLSCNTSQSLNECHGRKVMMTCDNVNNPVCFSTTTYINGKASISKGCMNDSICHQLAKQNAETCNSNLHNRSCTFCCLSDNCNDDQMYECGEGTFGMNCQNNCSGNCLNEESCNVYTGHCGEGCTSGWTSVMCDKKCSHGFYGQSCTQRCDNCDLSCHHITGECLVAIEIPGTTDISGSTTVEKVVMIIFIVFTCVTMAIIAVLVYRNYKLPCRNRKRKEQNGSTADSTATGSQFSELADVRQHYEGINRAFTTDNTYDVLQPGNNPEYENTRIG